MARLVFGPLVTAIKGSIGGVTFQSNPSGNIARSRPHLTKVSTVKQTVSHANMLNLLQGWQSITQVNRDAWNTYAGIWTKENKFGQQKKLTGQNWYCSVNYYQLLVGSPFLPNPPTHILPMAPPEFTPDFTTGAMFITFESAFDYTNNSLLIWASTPTRKNTLSINQVRKFLLIQEIDPGFALNITGAWNTATGLTWHPGGAYFNTNIYICIQSINKTSRITSSLLCSRNKITVGQGDSEMYYYSW